MIHIAAVESKFPQYYYSQQDLLASMRKMWSAWPDRLEMLERFYHSVKVDGRYLALPIEQYAQLNGFGESNQCWLEIALELGEEVICNLLDRVQLDPQEIEHIAFTTVTGIAVPSIDARLMNRIPFSKHLKRMPLFGFGCTGGAAGLARVSDTLNGQPDQAALMLSIELCSLTLQKNDDSVENLISSGLFGDGAACVLLVGDEHPLAQPGQPQVIASSPVFFPETEWAMGWEVRDTGFKMMLDPRVTPMVQEHLCPAVRSFLQENDLSVTDITHWVVHPGGPKILDALEEGLELPPEALAISRETLAAVGNVSSASVLLVLEETLKRSTPAPGAYGFLMGMGPAFSAEMLLLKW